MRKLTVNYVARQVPCCSSTIHRLCQEQKIPFSWIPGKGKHGKRVLTFVSKDEAVEAVRAQLKHKSGWKRGTTKAKSMRAVRNGFRPESDALQGLLTWAALAAPVRDLLLQLGKKYSEADLRLLVDL